MQKQRLDRIGLGRSDGRGIRLHAAAPQWASRGVRAVDAWGRAACGRDRIGRRRIPVRQAPSLCSRMPPARSEIPEQRIERGIWPWPWPRPLLAAAALPSLATMADAVRKRVGQSLDNGDGNAPVTSLVLSGA